MTIEEGKKELQELLKRVDTIHNKTTEEQIRFHQAFHTAMEAISSDRDEKKYPRKYGKSMAVGITVAACMVCNPSTHPVAPVASTIDKDGESHLVYPVFGRRVSKKLYQLVLNMAKELKIESQEQ